MVPKLFGSSESGHKVKNCQRMENRSSVARVKFSNLVSTPRKTLMTRLSFCRTSGLTSFKGLHDSKVVEGLGTIKSHTFKFNLLGG